MSRQGAMNVGLPGTLRRTMKVLLVKLGIAAACMAMAVSVCMTEVTVYAAEQKVFSADRAELNDVKSRNDGENQIEIEKENGNERKKEDIQKKEVYLRPEQPTVYLTFDDGPSGLTPLVLDILREEGVKATFFVLGSQAERYPNTVKRIVQEGHAIGNHSYDHRYEALYSDVVAFIDQIVRTDEIIHKLTGSRTSLFRAPGGSYTNLDDTYIGYLRQAGYSIFDWNVDSGDSLRRDVLSEEIVARATTGAKQRHQMIVLLHDGAGHEETVKALPEIIRYYKDRGYVFAPLDLTVEPVMLSLGTLRWARNYTQEQHDQVMAMLERIRPAGGNETNAEAEERENGETRRDTAASEAQRQRLHLTINGRTVVLDEDEFYVVQGRFHVPVDVLAERMGGYVAGGAAGRAGSGGLKIGAVINGQDVIFDLSGKSMTIRRNGRDTAHYSAVSAALRDGRLFVPLRGTVEALGGSIPSYEKSGSDWHVSVLFAEMNGLMRSLFYSPSYMAKVWQHLQLR